MRRIGESAGRTLWIWVAGGLVVCGLAGCEQQMLCQKGIIPEPSGPPRVTLAPGDVLDVRFFYTPELNVSQTVRPDGKIALQLVGEVTAEGKTPAELRQELLTLYQSHLKEPDVAVIVQTFYRRRIFVSGEVLKPGPIPMPGQMTVLDAIMEAGGFRWPTAEAGSVVILRHKDDTQYGYCIDLKPALKGGEFRPFYLEPEDTIYVPQTRITELDQWMDQHINNLIPRTGIVILSQQGATTVGYSLR